LLRCRRLALPQLLVMLLIIINDGQLTWRRPQNQQTLWDFEENYLLTWTNTLLYW